MKKVSVVFGLMALSVTCSSEAQSLVKGADDAFRDSGSGWSFQKQIDGFKRIADPACHVDVCAANYEDDYKSKATVYVYAATSPAIDASYLGAKAAIEVGLKQAVLAQSFSEGPFRVGKSWPLVGEKIFYKIGIGAGSSQSNLYYFDVGKWVVKVRVSGPTADKEVLVRIDGFVRNQPWETLGLSAENCTGAACRTQRPLEIHGRLVEMLATMFIEQKLDRVFPKDLIACDPNVLASAFDAPAPAESVNRQIEVVGACAPNKGEKASLIRLLLPEDVLTEVEPSPDGLSLRGPISFVALGDGKRSYFTQLHDGKLGTNELTKIFDALRSTQRVNFAKGNRDGKKLTPEFRFLN